MSTKITDMWRDLFCIKGGMTSCVLVEKIANLSSALKRVPEIAKANGMTTTKAKINLNLVEGVSCLAIW